jgi:hypothetical protein
MCRCAPESRPERLARVRVQDQGDQGHAWFELDLEKPELPVRLSAKGSNQSGACLLSVLYVGEDHDAVSAGSADSQWNGQQQ